MWKRLRSLPDDPVRDAERSWESPRSFASRGMLILIPAREGELTISLAAAPGITLVELGLARTPGPNMISLSRRVGRAWHAGMMSLAGTAVGFEVSTVMSGLGFGSVSVVILSASCLALAS